MSGERYRLTWASSYYMDLYTQSEIEGLFMAYYYMDLYTQSEIEGLFMAHYYIDFLHTVWYRGTIYFIFIELASYIVVWGEGVLTFV